MTIIIRCDGVVVIYRGKLVESRPVEDIFKRPTNEYTPMQPEAMPDPIRIARPSVKAASA